MGALVGDNTLGTLDNDFYSTDTFVGDAVGAGSSTGAHAGNYTSLGFQATYVGWNFPGTWEILSGYPVGYYPALTWCGIDCGVIDPGAIPPPTPPTPPTPNGLGNFRSQFVTVQQITDDADLVLIPMYFIGTFMTKDMNWFYVVPMNDIYGHSIVIDVETTTTSQEAKKLADKAQSLLN
jgi:hypothetical protein